VAVVVVVVVVGRVEEIIDSEKGVETWEKKMTSSARKGGKCLDDNHTPHFCIP